MTTRPRLVLAGPPAGNFKTKYYLPKHVALFTSYYSEIDYSSLVTSTAWPSNQYWVELASDVDFSVPPQPDEREEVKEKIQNNFVQANVYFQTLNVQSLVQKKKFTVRDRLHYVIFVVILPPL